MTITHAQQNARILAKDKRTLHRAFEEHSITFELDLWRSKDLHPNASDLLLKLQAAWPAWVDNRLE